MLRPLLPSHPLSSHRPRCCRHRRRRRPLLPTTAHGAMPFPKPHLASSSAKRFSLLKESAGFAQRRAAMEEASEHGQQQLARLQELVEAFRQQGQGQHVGDIAQPQDASTAFEHATEPQLPRSESITEDEKRCSRAHVGQPVSFGPPRPEATMQPELATASPAAPIVSMDELTAKVEASLNELRRIEEERSHVDTTMASASAPQANSSGGKACWDVWGQGDFDMRPPQSTQEEPSMQEASKQGQSVEQAQPDSQEQPRDETKESWQGLQSQWQDGWYWHAWGGLDWQGWGWQSWQSWQWHGGDWQKSSWHQDDWQPPGDSQHERKELTAEQAEKYDFLKRMASEYDRLKQMQQQEGAGSSSASGSAQQPGNDNQDTPKRQRGERRGTRHQWSTALHKARKLGPKAEAEFLKNNPDPKNA